MSELMPLPPTLDSAAYREAEALELNRAHGVEDGCLEHPVRP